MVVLTHWPIYALLLVGPSGLLVNQVAFQAGPLSASPPASTAVDPLASVVLGLLLFGKLHGRPLAATLEALVLIVLAVALLRLARAEHDPPEPQPALPTSRLSMNANTGCGKDG